MLAVIFMAIFMFGCVSLYGIATVIDRLDKIIKLLEEKNGR